MDEPANALASKALRVREGLVIWLDQDEMDRDIYMQVANAVNAVNVVNVVPVVNAMNPMNAA